MFCSESREQSTYYKHCITATIEVYACYIQSKFKNTNPPKISNGARAQSAGAGSAFAYVSIDQYIYTFI